MNKRMLTSRPRPRPHRRGLSLLRGGPGAVECHLPPQETDDDLLEPLVEDAVDDEVGDGVEDEEEVVD